MSNILVTGANGQLGMCMKDVSKKYNEYNWFFCGRDDVPIDDIKRLDEYVEENKIDIIVNCAAYCNVDGAETESDKLYRSNELGVLNLSLVSKKKDILLIHISTDYVFNGKKRTPYKETDKTSPINNYGVSKENGEVIIRKIAGEFIVIRTSLVFSEYGQNFLVRMMDFIKKGNMRKVVFDQICRPTYAIDLSETIVRMFSFHHSGIRKTYHFANSGVCSRYDFAKMTEYFYTNGESGIFLPCLSSEFKTPAKRPKYSVLDTEKIEKELNISIPYWVDAVRRCVEKIKKHQK